MPDAENENKKAARLDLVNHTIRADPDAPKVFRSAELLCPRWPNVRGEGADTLDNPDAILGIEAPQLPLRGRRDLDAIDHATSTSSPRS